MAANNATQFIGSKISLISKAEIRYEGVLYALDVKKATISLAEVRVYGTEDRPTSRPNPQQREIYDYVIFSASDIKSIDVIEPPKQLVTSEPEKITVDPAVVEVSNSNSNRSTASGSGSFFPRNNGGPGRGGFGPSNRLTRQQRQKSFLDGLLRGQGNNSDQTQGGNDFGEMLERERGEGGRFRGNRGGPPRRDPFFDYLGRQDGSLNSPRGGRGGWMGGPGGRGGYRRRQGMFRQPQTAKVTFDSDFDFEKSNEELMAKLKDMKTNANAASTTGETTEVKEETAGSLQAENDENKKPAVIHYTKNNFFDTISCEALERAKGAMARPDWRKEFKLNAETFGLSGRRGGFYRNNGGLGFYNNAGYDNRWNNYGSPRPGGGYNNWYNNGQGRGAY